MKFFDWIFGRKKKNDIPPIPSWDEIVEELYDKHLTFSDEVIQVIYSKDRSMRYVILKDGNGFFTYQLEAIYKFDEEEWAYISAQDNAFPAMWEPFRGINRKSLFQSIDELTNEIKSEPEYKQYFD